MKYRLIGLAALVVMLAVTALAGQMDVENNDTRVHQHLTARQPDAGCDCDGSQLCTHLPLVVIDTGGVEMPGVPILDENNLEVGYTTTASGAEMTVAKLSVMSEESYNHHPSDEPDMECSALIRIRGNSSRYFSKKNYRLKLIQSETDQTPRNLPLLGMFSENDWVLHGPFLDKTLIRNYMWMNISAEIMGYAPQVRFCEVILNGEYQGVYLMMETIKEDANRVSLREHDEDLSQTSYLLRMDAAEEGNTLNDYMYYTFRMEFAVNHADPREINSSTGIKILYPQVEYQTQQVKDYIQRDISRVERGLYSSDMISGRYNYERELDVRSFIDYYILQEFLVNNDAFSRSTYFYRDLRGKLTIGPVWDYNNVLNNFVYSFQPDRLYLPDRGWYGRLMTDESFVEQVISRYQSLRKSYLSEEYLLEYIRATVAYLGPAIERNDAAWGFSYDPSQLSRREKHIPREGENEAEINPSSYEEAVAWMSEFVVERGNWLDENITSLRQYCHPSKTAAQQVE